MGFLFPSDIPDSEPKKQATERHQWAPTKKSQQKPVFSSQRTKKGADQKHTKLSDNNHSTLAEDQRENCVPPRPHHKGQVQKLDLHPSRGCNKAHQHLPLPHPGWSHNPAPTVTGDHVVSLACYTYLIVKATTPTPHWVGIRGSHPNHAISGNHLGSWNSHPYLAKTRNHPLPLPQVSIETSVSTYQYKEAPRPSPVVPT